MKKRIILISISFVLVILSLFLLFTKINNKIKAEEFNDNVITTKDNPITTKDNPITTKDNPITIEDIKEDNNTNNNPPSVKPNTPKITYSCPDGYQLQGQSCYQNVEANQICPPDMTEINTGCINFSEKEPASDETCPDGYYGLAMIAFGQPDKYYCYPIHNKIYTCPDGYSLNNKTCTKTIPATSN